MTTNLRKLTFRLQCLGSDVIKGSEGFACQRPRVQGNGDNLVQCLPWRLESERKKSSVLCEFGLGI